MRIRANYIALGISVYFVLLALSYASVTPFFEAPDELAHFLYTHNLLETGELPTLNESRDAIFASDATQRHHPPLYYMVGAALTFWTARDDLASYRHINEFAAIGTVKPNNQHRYLHNWVAPDGDSAAAIWIMRLWSIALGVATLWLIYGMGRLVFDTPMVGLLAMLLTASIPMFVFISASINNDNLVTFLYTAGVFWVIQTRKKRVITSHDMVLISLILAGIALSKVNGLSLFGVVYGALFLGAYQRRFTWRMVFLTIAFSAVASAALAGWWYVRNWGLYGDPMAQGIMRGIWGRGEVPQTLDAVLFEAQGVWFSVWMVLGKFNIQGPEWFYIYTTTFTLIGMLGLLFVWHQQRHKRSEFLLLSGVIMLLIATLIYTTREINVSQGRILYPALGAFAVLLMAGLVMLFRRWALVLVLPMAFMAVITPFTILPDAYRKLEIVGSVPSDSQIIQASAETLTLQAYRVTPQVAEPNDVVTVDVYFSGRHDDTLLLSVNAVNPVTQTVFGGADVYPGMTFTSQLDIDSTYHARINFELDRVPESNPPQRLQLALSWYDPNTDRTLTWSDANGNTLGGTLLTEGLTFVDGDYEPPPPENITDVQFGDGIALVGYALSAEIFTPGSDLTISLLWRYMANMDKDYTVTVGLLDESGELITQNDGMPAGYLTSAWVKAPDFPDVRTLTIPEDVPPGNYHLYVGWYDGQTGLRLMAASDDPQAGVIADNLYFVPDEIQITDG